MACSQPSRVLIVSRSAEWRERVRSALAPAPLAVEPFERGRDLLEAVRESDPSEALVVLDSFAEDLTAHALIRSIRECERLSELRILVVSHWSAEVDRVICFEHGADDFLAEPFFPRELLSRAQALLRRGRHLRAEIDRSEAVFGALAIDFRKNRVDVSGERVALTSREFDVLRILVAEEGRVVPRGRLLRELHGSPEAVSPRVIDTHVKSIRSKLGSARGLIETVRGVGYRFDPDRPPSC